MVCSRDPLAMCFTQTKGGGASARVHGEPLFRFSGTRTAVHFVMTTGVWLLNAASYAFNACYEWGTVHVLMCACLFFVSWDPLYAQCRNSVC